ncbi:YbdD/YjiX family protein [Actinomyces sp.]|uniref:YbdD/YjiX family protein n=1 Tax=Actinomyces sp. TaxID=29317 RepID=UPI0026DC63D2|nr:YbdD/YjiX family protein [Actinomyces sp.]MDO4900993.1 YbdD/YjiX family protein [Actinomyces sp.]
MADVPAGAAEAVGTTAPAARWARRIRAGLARARGLWRDFTGESAYDRYVERHRREHPDHAPISARQWWRARADFEGRNVSVGCC